MKVNGLEFRLNKGVALGMGSAFFLMVTSLGSISQSSTLPTNLGDDGLPISLARAGVSSQHYGFPDAVDCPYNIIEIRGAGDIPADFVGTAKPLTPISEETRIEYGF